MAIEIRGELPLEEVQRRVIAALGHHYEVTTKSDSVIKIRRVPLVTENVHVKWQGDRTTLQPAPGGAWIIQGINVISIHPRIRRALSRAFVASPTGEDGEET